MKVTIFRTMLLVALTLLSACGNKPTDHVHLSVGPQGINVNVEHNGALTTNLTPEKEVSVAPGAIWLLAGVNSTPTLTVGHPKSLYVLWTDDSGIVRQDAYEIGTEFDLIVEGQATIKEIKGQDDSIIVVLSLLTHTATQPASTQTKPIPPAGTTVARIFYYCTGLPSKIAVGMRVYVPDDGGGPTALRDLPHSPNILRRMPPLTQVQVIDGPYCGLENTLWWRLRTDDGLVGWSVDHYQGLTGVAPLP